MNYRHKLHVHNVVWTFPNKHRLKCNTNGASKGNPGLNSYALCLYDSHGDLVYANEALEGQWKIPWEMVERGKTIRKRAHELNASITHTFREANSVADLFVMK
ncbi:hypothetical protein H5410_046182 [Solanum commersonii]|uniref:RNase H type-1 domain-containing protein n=1 Tax=Solanum commersonii TaxID=4109 RepID=A0A9J5XEU8_SOLCO|nr:hypothetical protein H5410_046182 [Solanum commersonii]